MVRVARYTSMVLAEQAAMWLRDEGIEASVVGHHVHDINISLDRRPYEVVVANKEDAPRANQLITERAARDPEIEAPVVIEEGEWRPDLSGLDQAKFGVRCPGCDTALPMDGTLEACPACATPVDLVDLIVTTHGPEAFEAMDPDEASARESGVIGWDARCESCKASLRGQTFTGRCAACGSLYAVDPR